MFAVNCPYCQTVNKRGARFCADCGAPLHLKPCPKCGKVDDVTAKKCGSCGTAFPLLELAEYRPDDEPVAGPAAPRSAVAKEAPAAAAPHAAFKPGPLIVIALVAGGLPLLWMNRAQFMPSPESLAPPPGRLAVPVVPAPPAAAVPALSAPAVQPPPVEPTPSPPAVVPPARAVEAARPAAPAGTQKPGRPAAKPVSKPAAPEPPVVRPATEAPAPQRECTESLAALGLCDRSQIRK